jgi:uncharacterized DUF497 family protein
MRFTWDPAKAARNLREHGVTFSEAATAFGDPFGRYQRDKDHGDRGVLLGRSAEGRVLFVVHVQLLLLDGGVVRIVSARKASRSQRIRYEEEQDE